MASITLPHGFYSLVKMRRARWWIRSSTASLRSLLLLGMFFVMSGCALRSTDVATYQALDYPPPGRDARQATPDTLMVYRFLLDPTVDDYALTISKRKGGEDVETAPRWRNHPADMMTDLIRRDLERSGLFQRTVDHFSTVPYRYALEGIVRELDAIIRDGKTFARIQVDVNLTDFDAPQQAGKALLKKKYRAEIPIPDTNPATVVAALNRGISDFSSQLRSDIRAALYGKGQLDRY